MSPTDSEITSFGSHIQTPDCRFRVDRLVGRCDEDDTAELLVIDETTALFHNDTTVIGYFDGSRTVFEKSLVDDVVARRTRRASTPSENSNVRVCTVKVWISEAFLSEFGSETTAMHFGRIAIELAALYISGTDFGTGFTFTLAAEAAGIVAVPSELSLVNKILWLVDTVESPGCLNILFDIDDADVRSGISILEGACTSTDNWAIVNSRDPAAAASLVAHESGHSFGAQHDTNECGSSFIMFPVLHSYATDFSVCSVDDMRPVIASLDCLSAGVIPGYDALGFVLLSFSMAASVAVFGVETWRYLHS